MSTPEDYRRVARAIAYIEDHAREQPTLDQVAEAVGLSPHHFHRLFRRWAGTTPKRFLQYLTVEAAKERLEASRSVLETAWDVGLSGPGRLHDHFVTMDGVTPGEHASGGEGLEIQYGISPSAFGPVLVARTPRGVCHLSFLADQPAREDRGPREGEAVERLKEEWPRAAFNRDDVEAARITGAMFRGERPPLHVRGTNFQVKVWEALLRIPPGHVASYGQVARGMGRPGAARAVAGAVARNRVAWLIPCHRVIRQAGEIGGYRWGPSRKRAMLAWEAVRKG